MNSINDTENRMVSEFALSQYYGDSPITRNAAQAAYAATERRLYALPILRERIEDNREELTELETLGVGGLRHHSASLVRRIPPRWQNFAPALLPMSGRYASCRTPSTPWRRIPIISPSS